MWTWLTTLSWTSKWLWRWWRFTRSRIPASPRTWKGSHHGEAKPPYHRLLGRCRLCRLLLRLVLDLCPLEATLATRLEARGSSASSCTRNRCFFNCHQQFYGDDGIVATKGCFSAENLMFLMSEDDKALVFIWVLLSDTLWCSHVFVIRLKCISHIFSWDPQVEFSSSIYQIITLTKSKSKLIIFHRILLWGFDLPAAPSHLHLTRLWLLSEDGEWCQKKAPFHSKFLAHTEAM